MRSPAFTLEPMSTGIRVIVPDAFDFTSTTFTGSTVPFACTVRTILRRSTAAVSMMSAVSFFFLHALTPSPASITIETALRTDVTENGERLILP
ncbi:MAG: hypothetical protein ACJ77S_11790 [Gemmatimonadaceae bacterium]